MIVMEPVEVDIDQLLDDVASVLVERETGRRQAYHSEVRESEDVFYMLPGVWQQISESLVAVNRSLDSLEAAAAEERPSLPGRIADRFKELAKRIIQKSVYWYVNPVVARMHRLHDATERALREIADQLHYVNDRLAVLENQNLLDRVVGLEGERLDDRIGRLERSLLQGRPTDQAFDRKDGSAGEVEASRGVGTDRISHSDRRLGVSPLQFDYYWFESIHRGDRKLVKRRQQPYLKYFEGCSEVIDVGCGRGEFLELMGEKGIGGYGIDVDRDAVRHCQDSGLEVHLAEAAGHLSSLDDESLDGAFVSQVAEHMTPSELLEMVGLLYRKVKPGSSVIIETPNPQCLLIFASFFYADLSHVQPVHPESLRFLLLSAGFKDIEIKLVNPVPKNQRLAKIDAQDSGDASPLVDELNRNFEKLNSVLFSYMDYAAIARK